MMTILLVVIFISFIGVGLPDSVLGAAWPAIYTEFSAPVSLAGYISSTVSACTIISSLLSSRIINKFGTGLVTFASTLMTAAALLGFALCKDISFFFLMAIPLGLGAGSIDTALNNFVALHYNASKMNFLHCFYGLGVAASPYIVSLALSGSESWRKGYLAVSAAQFFITIVSALSLPLWFKVEKGDRENAVGAKSSPSILSLAANPKVRMSCIAFFTSCALELCAGAWSSTYFVNAKGLPQSEAARTAMLFYAGLASGRFLSGVFSNKLGRRKITLISSFIVLFALIVFALRIPVFLSAFSLFLIGLGIGPVYPNLTHLTPDNFGSEASRAVMGLQQAFSYTGIMIMPWIFGIIADRLSASVLPFYLIFLYLVFIISLLRLFSSVEKNKPTE